MNTEATIEKILREGFDNDIESFTKYWEEIIKEDTENYTAAVEEKKGVLESYKTRIADLVDKHISEKQLIRSSVCFCLRKWMTATLMKTVM